MRFVLACLFSFPFLHAVGCGDNAGGGGADNDPFDTYQACFDEHHKTETFPVGMAIEICCIDHPIGSADMNVVCGATAASCESYVTDHLADADATADDITAACTAYVVDRAG